MGHLSCRTFTRTTSHFYHSIDYSHCVRKVLIRHEQFTIVHEYFQSSSNNYECGQSSTPFLTEICNYKMNFICNLIHVLLVSLLKKADWERDGILNHGKRRWATAWTKMIPECNWDDIFGGLNQPTIFYSAFGQWYPHILSSAFKQINDADSN